MPWNDTPKTIQPMETKWKPDHNKNTIEEDLYANGKQEVSKEDLEKYLPRAIHSSETTLEFNVSVSCRSLPVLLNRLVLI